MTLPRITQKAETNQGVVTRYGYIYDAVGRLTQVHRNDTLVATYEYDANGNRLAKITQNGTVTGTYDAQDRLLTYSTTSYFHTASGDLRFKVEGSDTTRYVYDAFGSLMSVQLSNGALIEYLIDGNERRTGRKVNGMMTHRLLYSNNLRIVAELDSANNILTRFVYTSSENVPEYLTRAGVPYRIVTDHIGSVRQVVDTRTGAVIQQIDYDEFGNVISDSNPGFTPFGFAGGVYDVGTGLVRFGARDYEPTIGRWTGKDPLFFASGSTNHYSYCRNDPVNVIDPRGTNSVASGIHSALMLGVSVTEMVETINDMLQAAASKDYRVLTIALAKHTLAAASFGVSAAEFTANIFGKTTGLGNEFLEMTLRKIGTGERATDFTLAMFAGVVLAEAARRTSLGPAAHATVVMLMSYNVTYSGVKFLYDAYKDTWPGALK